MGTRMPSALDTETVVIQAPDKPFYPASGDPKGPPVDPFSRGRGGGGGDDDRPNTPSGMGMFGMRIALIPITVLFIATAFIYYVRSRTGINWRSVPMPTLLWLSTALMLVSSWTLERARAALRSANYGSYARWLLRTLSLGLGFLDSQALALQQLVTRGLFMRHNPHSSLFYVITGSHGAHLFGGLVALAYPLLRSRPDAARTAVVVTALYYDLLAGLV